MGQTRLLLASASPRRRELLRQLQIDFEIAPADVDESIDAGETAKQYVERIAKAKAERIAQRHSALVLAADTAVVLKGEVLGKPATPQDAEGMLQRLSGRSHEVLTAVVLDGDVRARRVVRTQVQFRELSAAQIRWYVRTAEPMDKAGAYAIQGIAGAFVERVDGSVSNVIGLPLAETLELLQHAGYPLPWSTT